MTIWCKTPECVWEALSAVIFVLGNEYVPVCYQCECAINMVLSRLDPKDYDIMIVPIEDIGEYFPNQEEKNEGL